MLLLSNFHIRESAYSVMGTGPKNVGRGLGTFYITWQNNCCGVFEIFGTDREH